MIQNLRVDIIYNATPSDFEFEFNLGGCCRSRILTSNTSSESEFISSLSKAVSRSRVIFIIGKLYGENNIISLTSSAVNIDLVEPDERIYSIKNKKALILDGSLPLICSDGTFGGCIIEKGPQSIILISDDKAVRKNVMTQLVDAYITAISNIPDTDSVILTETDTVANEESTVNESISESSDEIDIYSVTDDDDSSNKQLERKPFDFGERHNEHEVVYDNVDNDYKSYNVKQYNGLKVALIIVIGLIILSIAAIAFFGIYEPLSNGRDPAEIFKNLFNFL